jgi:hypothetical protein
MVTYEYVPAAQPDDKATKPADAPVESKSVS